MNQEELTELENMALRVREHIIRLSTDGGCFTGASLSCADLIVYLYSRFLNAGASLSCADLIVYLYSRFLNVGPHNFEAPDRDYFFLSKGHDVPALYGTFVELGWLAAERLHNHLKTNDTIYWHPNRNIPGIEFHSGSLGHLPSVAVGVAMDCKMRGLDNRIVVITGDGELNEGSVWETLLVANAYRLDNLLFIVDRNHFQANIRTEDLIPLEPLAPKFEAFGWRVKRVDGHSFSALEEALTEVPFASGQPSVLIADTVRGRGLPSIQERADRWFCNFTHEEVDALLQELYGVRRAEIESEALIVR